MTKEKRSLIFMGIASVVLWLIFCTPFGFIWLISVCVSLLLAQFILPQPINFFLWVILCYLVTVLGIWYALLNNHGLPERFFNQMEKRLEGRKK